MTNLQEMLSRFIGLCATTTEVDFKVIQKLMLDLFWTFGIIVLPILGATVLSAIIATMMQTRMLVAMERTKFKMSKLNPLNGIKGMFSLRSVVELVKSNLKIIVLGAVIYNILKDQMGPAAPLDGYDAASDLNDFRPIDFGNCHHGRDFVCRFGGCGLFVPMVGI